MDLSPTKAKMSESINIQGFTYYFSSENWPHQDHLRTCLCILISSRCQLCDQTELFWQIHKIGLCKSVRYTFLSETSKFTSRYLNFFFFLMNRCPFCGVTGTLCFRLQKTLLMGFKARVNLSLPVLFCGLCAIIPRAISGCQDWALNPDDSPVR